MVSPQAENGHVDIANEIVDRLCSYRISGQEWQILWVIIRKTWGWKKKLDWIALSQFQGLTGIDRRKCHSLLQKLCSKNIVQRVVTQKGDTLRISYGIQKDFDKWRLSPKKVTVTQKGDGLSPKKVMGVSPKKTHTKDTITKDTITKDMSKFELFWEAYPKKRNKGQARKAWAKINMENGLFEKILEKVTEASKTDQWSKDNGKYIPYPATWLNAEGWEDDVGDDFNKKSGGYYNLDQLLKEEENGKL